MSSTLMVRSRPLFPVFASFCAVAIAGGAIACGGSEPKTAQSAQASQQDGVPANSLSETRLKGTDERPKETPSATPASEDPTQPLMTPMSPGGTGDEAKAAGKPGAAATQPSPKTGKVSRQECAQLFDKYIELAIGDDARLDGLPPELLAQAKAQARAQKGDPCEKEQVPRSKYTCAMAATSPAQWQKCMK